MPEESTIKTRAHLIAAERQQARLKKNGEAPTPEDWRERAEAAESALRGLLATAYGQKEVDFLNRGIGTATVEGRAWAAARRAARSD